MKRWLRAVPLGLDPDRVGEGVRWGPLGSFLLLLPFLFSAAPLQDSPGSSPWTELWRAGKRSQALERAAQELTIHPEDMDLRQRLVEWELATSRFGAALNHSLALPQDSAHLQGQALYFLARYSDCLTLLRLDDSRELLMHAEALRALGRLQELHELLPTLKEVLGNDAPEVLLIEAREDLRSKNYEAAIVRFRHVLQRQPLETEALFGLGQALGRMGKKEQALSVLEHHRQLLPLLDALDFAQRGVQLAPRRASNLAHLGDAWSALVLHDPGANTQARQAYVEAQRFASAKEMVPILLRWARHVASMEGDLSAACQILRNALKSSADPRLRVRLADYLSDMGKQDEALEQLKLVLRQRPGDSAVLERIRQLGQEQEGK